MIFSSVIDELTTVIQRFVIIQNETRFESELSFICSKMESVEFEKDEKWEILQNNYSKLKYLYEVVNFYYLPNDGKFIKTLNLFMEKVDIQTKYYIKTINWKSDSDYKEDADLIKEFMEKSVNEQNPIEKLIHMYKAYKILVSVVEDIRGEKCETTVEPEFEFTFEQPSKRVKK